MSDAGPSTDELVNRLGSAIAGDDAFADGGWTGLAMVVSADERRAFGYRYTAGDWEADLPEDSGFIDDAIALRDAMAAQHDGHRWHSVLVQISGDPPTARLAFDYDLPPRWQVTPANMDAMVEALRPD